MIDQQIQQYIDQQVSNQIESKLNAINSEKQRNILVSQLSENSMQGQNVFGEFGNRIFHNILRLKQTEQAIVSGVIKATSPSILIATESSASTDDLDTIIPEGVAYQGEEIIMIRAKDDADTVVVKSGTGNIICAGGVGMSLDSVDDALWLRWDKLQAKWIEIFRYDSSSQANSTPAHIDIIALNPNTVSGTWTKEYRAVITGGDIYSSGAQNEYIQFNTYLSPGTYDLTLLYHKWTDRGIFTIYVDDLATGTAGTTSIGTIDSYAAGVVDNVFSTISGFTVATGGQKAIRLSMKTKNASASAYYAVVSMITLTRTTIF